MSTTRGSVRSTFFPYCLEQQLDGSWQILNRDYKPVTVGQDRSWPGVWRTEAVPIKGLGPATLAKLSYNGEASNKVYLYNDGCIPTSSAKAMKSYLDKLEILLKLRIA